MEITTWTVKDQRGNTVDKNIANLEEWLKRNTSVLVVATLPAIKEVIIYA